MTFASSLNHAGSNDYSAMVFSIAIERAAYSTSTILIVFHHSAYRHFKAFYLGKVCLEWHCGFLGLVSYLPLYSVDAICSTAIVRLCAPLFGRCTGISFVNSTSLKASRDLHVVVFYHLWVHRIQQYKVFTGRTARGETSVEFFGLKLHLIANDHGELLNFSLTPGNTDDRKPVPKLLQRLMGKVSPIGGYGSQNLAEQLLKTVGIQLITKLGRNMKNRLMALLDKLGLHKRSIMESVIDQLKSISQTEHSRHRRLVNLLVNLVCGLIAYCHQPKKPSLPLGIALPSTA